MNSFIERTDKLWFSAKAMKSGQSHHYNNGVYFFRFAYSVLHKTYIVNVTSLIHDGIVESGGFSTIKEARKFYSGMFKQYN